MIDRDHDLPVQRQARLLRLSRSSVYYLPRPVSASDLTIMRRLDELHLDFPFAGSRMMRDFLRGEGVEIGASNVRFTRVFRRLLRRAATWKNETAC
jgi:putative transposase